MEDIEFVKGSQPYDDLDEDGPDLGLGEVGVVLLVLADLLEEVAIVRELHDQTKGRLHKLP